MKKLISIILAAIILVCCSSCGKGSASGGKEYNFETDFQINTMQADSTAVYTLSPTGVYTVQGTILRYFENGSSFAVPICARPECMHLDYGTNVHECDAYIGSSVIGMDYYNGSLYIASHYTSVDSPNGEDGCKLVEYTLQGKYVRTISDLPYNVQSIIQHRGVFYYIGHDTNENDEIIYTLSYVTADGKENGIICKGNDQYFSIHAPSAYGKYLYYVCYEYSENGNNYYTAIYDLETKDTTKLDKVQQVYFCNDKLVYVRLENGFVYTSNFDGTNEKEYIKLEYVNALLYAYDDIVIASNFDTYDASDDWSCEFALYKDGKFIRTFNLDDFAGGKWNEKRVTYNIFHTDDYIYMNVMPENKTEYLLVRFDREKFENGIFEPMVIDLEAIFDDSEIVYGD